MNFRACSLGCGAAVLSGACEACLRRRRSAVPLTPRQGAMLRDLAQGPVRPDAHNVSVLAALARKGLAVEGTSAPKLYTITTDGRARL